MKYNGKTCPKCGRVLNRKGKTVRCPNCCWCYTEKDDNLTKWLRGRRESKSDE